MKKQRKLVVGFLLLLALVVSGFTYAYWAGGILEPVDEVVNNNSVKIGEGEGVVTEITAVAVTSDKELIPTAYADDDEDKETLEFTVLWSGNGAAGATGTLEVTISNIEINGQDINGHGLDGKDMFVITVVTGDLNITAGTDKEIEILVTFAVEPMDLATYNIVSKSEVTFTVTFKVIPTP
jgi:hypothetical protein